MRAPLPSLTVAVLAYDEEATIEAAVRHVHEALVRAGTDFEILVVDDGSRDRTAAIADELAGTLDGVRLIRHGRNRGPGSGVLTGMQAATKDVFTFYAADMQGDFAERLVHLGRIGPEADLLVGQRSGSCGTGPWRRLTSSVFSRSMRALFGLELEDYNFFYFFSREVLEAVEPRSRTAFLCPEVMVRAVDAGYRAVPVTGVVRPRRAGRATVGNLRHVAAFTADMLALWLERRVRRGRGGASPAPRGSSRGRAG